MVRRSPFSGALMLGVWLAGVLLAVRMALQIDSAAAESGWRMAVVAMAPIACGAFAAVWWLRAPQGRLRWDGQGWWWQPNGGPECTGMPSLRLDLQARLLVRWCDSADRRVSWFWLQDDAADSAWSWHALRCALQMRSRIAPDSPPGVHASTAVVVDTQR